MRRKKSKKEQPPKGKSLKQRPNFILGEREKRIEELMKIKK